MKNGTKVTTAAMWKARRAEILDDFEREVYGRRPKNIPKVTWTVTSTTDSTSGTIPTIVKQLVGHVDNSAAPAINVDIQATLTTPKNASGPVPVMLIFSGAGFGFPAAAPAARAGGAPAAAVPARGPAPAPTPCDNPTAKAYFAAHPDGPPPAPVAARGAGAPGGFGRGAGGTPPAPCSTGPCAQLLARGWGYATFNTGSVQADNGGGLTAGIIGLVNKGQHRAPDDWGVLSAWAWGASRVLDYFETDKAVDAKMVGLEGHSRWGKATIVAMAFDERFAIAYVSSSGEGGAKLHRRKFGELVQNVAATNEYHWMAENHTKYAADWNAMPVDSHELDRAVRAAARLHQRRQGTEHESGRHHQAEGRRHRRGDQRRVGGRERQLPGRRGREPGLQAARREAAVHHAVPADRNAGRRRHRVPPAQRRPHRRAELADVPGHDGEVCEEEIAFVMNKPGTFLIFAAVLGALASGCRGTQRSSGGKDVPVTKTLKMKIPDKVAFVIWSVLRGDHCSVQIGSPEAPNVSRTQLWLLKSDGTAIPQAQNPVRLNVAMANRSQALAIYDFTSAGCAKAVSVVLNVDDQFLVEPLN